VTEHAEPRPAESPLGTGLRQRWSRERALLALFDLGRRKGFGLRAAKLYAFGVFCTYAIAIWIADRAGSGEVGRGFVRAALVALSWVVGALAALGTARALAAPAERDALSALAFQRGFDRRDVLRARTLGAALRIWRLVAIPALLLVLLALARGQSIAWAVVATLGIALYAAALGLFLALLAQFSAELSSRHPRALLSALVLGPLLLSQLYPAIPSVSGAFAALLDRVLEAAARFA